MTLRARNSGDASPRRSWHRPPAPVASKRMDVTPLQPLGARVTGLAVGPLDPRTAQQMRLILAERGVVVLPDQSADDDAFVAFLRSFGPLAFTTGETAVDGHPDLNVVSNVGRTTPPRSSFHVDTSYVREPPAYTALRAVAIPARGGETLFTDQYRAWQTLDADLRSRIEGRIVTHVATGVELGPDDESAAGHPFLRPHPLTGRTALYLSSAARLQAVSGMEPDEAGRIVARLIEHSTQPVNVYRHAWAPGDVVMWDNACVLHRADHDGVVGDRVMHRGMVARYSAAA
jgi:taurine dioxygenase